MYPPSFEYSAPGSLEEALGRLGELGEEARVLAGGQSLIPMMKLRLAAPAHLVDINRLGDLAYIRRENGHLAVGALARHADVVASPDVKAIGAMADAAPWIADPLVRNRGTLVGSVAHCDPEGDWNSVMLALGATVVAASTGGEREIPISDFIVDFFTNSLQPGEMVKEIRVPITSGTSGGTYLKLERKIGDYATVGVATHLELDDQGRISRAGIGLTNVHNYNLKAVDAEGLLMGQEPSEGVFAQAADAAAEACQPASDIRGPAEYKRAVVREYVKRALTASLAAARGEG
ncbi:MAG TPA: xanthine dehydrogenase family protein subunit M [Acidimicrobiia bacterium]|nr:xanthine dehydrogenase family protein subunit M [Acidimicrobiia bacterium]